MGITWHRAVVVLLGLVVAGCSGSGTAPTSPSPATGQTSSGPLGALANPDVAIFNVGAAATSDRPGPCTLDPATGQFVCPDQNRDGITFTKRFTLYDANGNVQSNFDRATTASIRTETTATGTATRDRATVTVDRSGTMLTSGLGPGAAAHTLNGSERGTIVATSTAPDGTTITTSSAVTITTTNLVVPVRTREGGRDYPESGMRVHETVATTTRGSESRTVTTRRQETFDGTNIVNVEITVNGVIERCTYDLAARTSTCSRR